MQATTQRLSVQDRQKVARIIQPAALAARLLNEYMRSAEFNEVLTRLVREELGRQQRREVCHGSH